jgi:hypothetical protein
MRCTGRRRPRRAGVDPEGGDAKPDEGHRGHAVSPPRAIGDPGDDDGFKEPVIVAVAHGASLAPLPLIVKQTEDAISLAVPFPIAPFISQPNWS